MSLRDIELALQRQRKDKTCRVEVEKITNDITEVMRPGDVVYVTSSGNSLHGTWTKMKQRGDRK